MAMEQLPQVFEIKDYTTASDWERFIAELEETLSQWDLQDQKATYYPLPNGFISSGFWHEKHDTIKFGKVTFDIRYQYLDDSSVRADTSVQVKETPECLGDIISTSNDFASKAHCLVRWYNFRRFITVLPRGDSIISEDRVKLILSSASIALANCNCHVPIFVQTHNPKNNFFQGISEHSNIRTMYEMVLMRQNFKRFAYLSELINLFREKSGCTLNDQISATVRLNYCLDYFELFLKPEDEFTGAEHSDEEEEEAKKEAERSKQAAKRKSKLDCQDLRAGATFEQVVEALDECLPHPFRILRFLHVAALWPPISDKVIADSRVHSDLDPAEAPIWTIRCVSSDNCNLKIVHEIQAIYQLLKGAIAYSYDKLDASQVFIDCDRESMEKDCLKLSYKLATMPEVVLSDKPSDNIRKLIALIFHRASEFKADDPLDEITSRLKKETTSLNELYRDFRKNKTSVKEFIVRSQIPRPYEQKSDEPDESIPQHMFCTISDDELRLCGAFSEWCN